VSLYASVTPLPPIPEIETLTYSVSDEMTDRVQPGMRVLVPLGARRITALVLARVDSADPKFKLKDVEDVLDESPVVPADLLALVEWMAEYYLCSRGDVLALAIGRGLTSSSRRVVKLVDPTTLGAAAKNRVVVELLKAGRPMSPARLAAALKVRSVDSALASLKKAGVVTIDEVLDAPKVKPRFQTRARVIRIPDEGLATQLFGRAPKRREVYEHLVACPDRSATLSELSSIFPSPKSVLAALESAGIVKLTREEDYRSPELDTEVTTAPTLNPAQQEAMQSVSERLGQFAPFLLFGVTASGKTEIYLELIRQTLERGESALLLVPEISLTHQVVGLLRGRFGDDVAVLHSELSAGERWDEWRRISRGHARVAIGARSAVLAPLLKLGLIIVDEEHDPSYKQGDGVRYHARDVAVLRAREAGCPIVLGTATPSMESWRHATQERYTLLTLEERATPTPLPRVEVVDLRGHDLIAQGGIGDYLGKHLKENVEAGGQTLLFLNRRGFASSLQCYECGETLECKNCSVGLTLHRDAKALHCHHCDNRLPVPKRCPSCDQDALFSQGIGTQRLEESVRALVPTARIARLDRDAAATKGSTASVLRDWRAGRIDVLIGTQMITKGHDVAGVNLVGVIHADQSLGVPDFRASERTFALLCQVAGRAGRGEERGRVIMQTYQPEHPAIAAAAHHDFRRFADLELADRAELGYPPWQRLVLLRFEGPQLGAVDRIANAAARALAPLVEASPGLRLRGPAPALVERIKGRFRFKIEIQSESPSELRMAAAEARARVAEAAKKASVRVLIDIDPYDLV
jgi:primosomal protein N' (replication factor Y)